MEFELIDAKCLSGCQILNQNYEVVKSDNVALALFFLSIA